MQAMLPVMVAAGFLALLISAVAPDPGEGEGAEHWILNLALAHGESVDEAASLGFASGLLAPTVPWPFRDLATWRGEVVIDGGRTLVLTWPAIAPASLEVARRLAAGPLSWLPEDRSGGRELAHLAGTFTNVVGGNSLIGSASVPTPSSVIATGTPVMASWVLP